MATNVFTFVVMRAMYTSMTTATQRGVTLSVACVKACSMAKIENVLDDQNRVCESVLDGENPERAR